MGQVRLYHPSLPAWKDVPKKDQKKWEALGWKSGESTSPPRRYASTQGGSPAPESTPRNEAAPHQPEED